MTNEQAEIQQAAREHHDRWRERGQVSTPQDRLAEKVDFHISQSEEERKELEETWQKNVGLVEQIDRERAKRQKSEAEVARLRGALEYLLQVRNPQHYHSAEVDPFCARCRAEAALSSAVREVKG